MRHSFLSENSLRLFSWVSKLWNKWLETATETILKVSLDSIFDNSSPLLIKISNGEEFSPRTLYHIAATIQMYLKDQSKGKGSNCFIIFVTFLINSWLFFYEGRVGGEKGWSTRGEKIVNSQLMTVLIT